MSLTRREFLKGTGAVVLLSSVPVWMRCTEETAGPLSKHQAAVARRVFRIIFPDDGMGPDAERINAPAFLEWILRDPFYDPDIQQMLVQGIDALDAHARSVMGADFLSLEAHRQEALLDEMAARGHRWLSRMVTVVLEALLSDPIYGGNVHKAGWQWLGHYEGRPRPDERTRYEVLMRKRRGGHV